MKYQTDLEASGCQEFLRKVFSAFAWNLLQTTDLSLSLFYVLPSPLFFCVILRIINCRLHFPNAVCTKHQSSNTTQYITAHHHLNNISILLRIFSIYPALALALVMTISGGHPKHGAPREAQGATLGPWWKGVVLWPIKAWDTIGLGLRGSAPTQNSTGNHELHCYMTCLGGKKPKSVIYLG